MHLQVLNYTVAFSNDRTSLYFLQEILQLLENLAFPPAWRELFTKAGVPDSALQDIKSTRTIISLVTGTLDSGKTGVVHSFMIAQSKTGNQSSRSDAMKKVSKKSAKKIFEKDNSSVKSLTNKSSSRHSMNGTVRSSANSKHEDVWESGTVTTVTGRLSSDDSDFTLKDLEVSSGESVEEVAGSSDSSLDTQDETYIKRYLKRSDSPKKKLNVFVPNLELSLQSARDEFKAERKRISQEVDWTSISLDDRTGRSARSSEEATSPVNMDETLKFDTKLRLSSALSSRTGTPVNVTESLDKGASTNESARSRRRVKSKDLTLYSDEYIMRESFDNMRPPSPKKRISITKKLMDSSTGRHSLDSNSARSEDRTDSRQRKNFEDDVFKSEQMLSSEHIVTNSKDSFFGLQTGGTENQVEVDNRETFNIEERLSVTQSGNTGEIDEIKTDLESEGNDRDFTVKCYLKDSGRLSDRDRPSDELNVSLSNTSKFAHEKENTFEDTLAKCLRESPRKSLTKSTRLEEPKCDKVSTESKKESLNTMCCETESKVENIKMTKGKSPRGRSPREKVNFESEHEKDSKIQVSKIDNGEKVSNGTKISVKTKKLSTGRNSTTPRNVIEKNTSEHEDVCNRSDIYPVTLNKTDESQNTSSLEDYKQRTLQKENKKGLTDMLSGDKTEELKTKLDLATENDARENESIRVKLNLEDIEKKKPVITPRRSKLLNKSDNCPVKPEREKGDIPIRVSLKMMENQSLSDAVSENNDKTNDKASCDSNKTVNSSNSSYEVSKENTRSAKDSKKVRGNVANIPSPKKNTISVKLRKDPLAKSSIKEANVTSSKDSISRVPPAPPPPPPPVLTASTPFSIVSRSVQETGTRTSMADELKSRLASRQSISEGLKIPERNKDHRRVFESTSKHPRKQPMVTSSVSASKAGQELSDISESDEKLVPKQSDGLPSFMVQSVELKDQKGQLRSISKPHPNQIDDLSNASQEQLSSIADILRKVSLTTFR